MTVLTREETKLKESQKKAIVEVWRSQYRKKQEEKEEQEEDYSDYSNNLLKCFQLLNTGYALEAGEISKNLTKSDHHVYIEFIRKNMERLKGVALRRMQIPVINID